MYTVQIFVVCMIALRVLSPLFPINSYFLQETALSRDLTATSQQKKNHSTEAKADYGAMAAKLSTSITPAADTQERNIKT